MISMTLFYFNLVVKIVSVVKYSNRVSLKEYTAKHIHHKNGARNFLFKPNKASPLYYTFVH